MNDLLKLLGLAIFIFSVVKAFLAGEMVGNRLARAFKKACQKRSNNRTS